MVGGYIKTLESFERVDKKTGWATFKEEMKEEYKEEDKEYCKYSEAYLRKITYNIREKKDASVADYRAFIMDFMYKSDVLVDDKTIGEFKRLVIFLQTFSDKMGDKL